MWLSCCKNLFALLRGVILKHDGEIYCLNCFHSYSTEKNLKKHEKVCNDHDYCYVEMSEKDNKILKYNNGENSMKAPFIIYADVDCFLEKMHSCQNNPEDSSTAKINLNTPSSYSLFTQCYLIQQRANLIVIGVKNVWKGSVKI